MHVTRMLFLATAGVVAISEVPIRAPEAAVASVNDALFILITILHLSNGEMHQKRLLPPKFKYVHLILRETVHYQHQQSDSFATYA